MSRLSCVWSCSWRRTISMVGLRCELEWVTFCYILLTFATNSLSRWSENFDRFGRVCCVLATILAFHDGKVAAVCRSRRHAINMYVCHDAFCGHKSGARFDATSNYMRLCIVSSNSRDMYALSLHTLPSLISLDSLLARLMPRDASDIESRAARH